MCSDVSSFIPDGQQPASPLFSRKLTMVKFYLYIYIFKKQLSVLMILSIGCLFSISSNLCFNLDHVFSSAYIRFTLLFFVFRFLRWKLSLLILDLSSIVIYAFNPVYFPLSTVFVPVHKILISDHILNNQNNNLDSLLLLV